VVSRLGERHSHRSAIVRVGGHGDFGEDSISVKDSAPRHLAGH
jgi:hypothetical protein